MASRPASITALATLVAASLACAGGFEAKPVPPEHMDLVGAWSGDGVVLTITEEGMVHYEKHAGADLRINGPVSDWFDTAFVVGAFGVGTTFHIEEAPHAVGSGWQTTIDGVVLTR